MSGFAFRRASSVIPFRSAIPDSVSPSSMNHIWGPGVVVVVVVVNVDGAVVSTGALVGIGFSELSPAHDAPITTATRAIASFRRRGPAGIEKFTV